MKAGARWNYFYPLPDLRRNRVAGVIEGVTWHPDGFIVPMAYGLRALLELDGDGHLAWKTDPSDFIDRHLDEIAANARC